MIVEYPSVTFSIELGALLRKSALFSLRAAAREFNVGLTEVDNDGGWLSTRYVFQAQGPAPDLARFSRRIKQLAAGWA